MSLIVAQQPQPKLIRIKDESKRIVMAAVYTPLAIDTDGETMTAEEIERMAHNFLMDGLTDRIDIQHDGRKSGCKVCESFIARENDPDFQPGEWVMAVKIFDDDVWELVLNGDLNGFSFFGWTLSSEFEAVIDHPVSGAGTTEPASTDEVAEHVHEVSLTFNDDSSIVPTMTAEAEGHSHEAFAGTSTGEIMGHSHRMLLKCNRPDDDERNKTEKANYSAEQLRVSGGQWAAGATWAAEFLSDKVEIESLNARQLSALLSHIQSHIETMQPSEADE